MGSLPIKPVVPGIRTLWVIKLHENKDKPDFDFYIPSPFNPREWMNTAAETNQQALDLLNKINQACSQIKHKCKDDDAVQTFKDQLQKAQGVFSHLENLEGLMKNFEDLMKRLSRPPSQESGPEEGKS